jgi:hypothetical protein
MTTLSAQPRDDRLAGAISIIIPDRLSSKLMKIFTISL